MRISDWSSDVCSSDLIGQTLPSKRRRAVACRPFVRFERMAVGVGFGAQPHLHDARTIFQNEARFLDIVSAMEFPIIFAVEDVFGFHTAIGIEIGRASCR